MAADVTVKFNEDYLVKPNPPKNTNTDVVPVPNKYCPFSNKKKEEIQVTPDGIQKVQAHMQYRMNQFSPYIFNELHFYGISDEEIREKEKGKAPPIVVISSGRATWIKEKLLNGKKVVGSGSLGITDVSIFKNGPVPFYYPKRYNNEAPRNFYIFVHLTEFLSYCTELDGFGINVIGWDTINRHTDPGEARESCVGFGMSRHVVFQFFKDFYERIADNPAHKKIWMMDDNVCHIQGFAGFKTYESCTKSGSGFRATPKQFSEIYFTNLSNSKSKNVDTQEEVINLDQDPTIFLQQAMLWNFDKIDSLLSYSPYFIASNEDITFCRVLIKNVAPFNQTKWDSDKGAEVLKCNVITPADSPDDPGLAIHNELKESIYNRMYQNATKDALMIAYPNSGTPVTLYKLVDALSEANPGKDKVKENKNICFVKSGEQITRAAMHESKTNSFDAVPQACFVSAKPTIINRYASAT